MYAYRWAFSEHTKWTGRLIAFDQHFGGGRENLERLGHEFEIRQVGRNPLVGCTEANMPMHVPGAPGQAHELFASVSHFLQEDVPEELVDRILKFIEATRP